MLTYEERTADSTRGCSFASAVYFAIAYAVCSFSGRHAPYIRPVRRMLQLFPAALAFDRSRLSIACSRYCPENGSAATSVCPASYSDAANSGGSAPYTRPSDKSRIRLQFRRHTASASAPNVFRYSICSISVCGASQQHSPVRIT